MEAQFSISVDAARDFLHIEIGGFFSEADIGAFRYTLVTKLEALACGPNEHLTLCDASAMKIQTQEIVAAFAQIVANPKYQAKRLAFVTGSSLARMQTRRLTNRSGVEYFTECPAAEAWLFD